MPLKSAPQADSFLFLEPKNLFILRSNFDYDTTTNYDCQTFLLNTSTQLNLPPSMYAPVSHMII